MNLHTFALETFGQRMIPTGWVLYYLCDFQMYDYIHLLFLWILLRSIFCAFQCNLSMATLLKWNCSHVFAKLFCIFTLNKSLSEIQTALGYWDWIVKAFLWSGLQWLICIVWANYIKIRIEFSYKIPYYQTWCILHPLRCSLCKQATIH